MKMVAAMVMGTSAALAFTAGSPTGDRSPATRVTAATISSAGLTNVVQRYCQSCHNPTQLKGNLNLKGFDVDSAFDHVATTEKMIRKLRAGMMPPPGSRRPTSDTLLALVETLEKVVDNAARPNPGTRTFQRLNRAEYEHAVRDLLNVEIDAGDFLPLDTKSANFDNIADAQLLSPTLLEAYLNAAAAVSSIAVGDRHAPSTVTAYTSSPFASQHPWDHVDGAPYGTRGGVVATHNFPADGMYSVRLLVAGGVGTKLEDIDVSIDGERAALIHYEHGIERAINSADAPGGGDYFRTEPIFVKAGQHRVSAAFVRKTDGPYEDLIKPHDWSRASNGTGSAGTTEPPHLNEMTVTGPDKITGLSMTPSRRAVFTCHPTGSAAQLACADQIIARIGMRAYRRPLTAHDREGLIAFYKRGAANEGFEGGVRLALQAILSSPYFVFRLEKTPATVPSGQDYRLSDFDLASRLSFFLWGSIPDDELLTLARQRKLSERATLEREVRRMLADPRSQALSIRFAAQWLRLQDLDKVHPDAFLFPDFDEQLADDMRRETELFFNDVVRSNRSVMDLFTADYTFVNERLARHYGIPNVSGGDFQRVQYPDSTRRGILGHGSILVQTSLANRTSPVLRGKWVMEVLLGLPPPPPPPNVPTLDETADARDGHLLTTRERMEIHRANATCRACHQYMDPIGLALDNFDVTGRWRYRENGIGLDTRGQLYDGTPLNNPADLSRALLKRPVPLVRSFIENLMAYSLGRRVEDYDQPAIRAIARNAEASGYKISSIILGVVTSDAFLSKRSDVAADDNSRER